jgi:hypothetical protein
MNFQTLILKLWNSKSKGDEMTNAVEMRGEVNFSVKIDDDNILEIRQPLDYNKIKTAVSEIEKTLLKNGASSKKIKDVFEIAVEMLQNILNYSYGSRTKDDHSKEADGHFRVVYNSQNDLYTMLSENLITSKQAIAIQEKIDAIKDLDDKALRKLMREKMRSRSDQHKHGAGLGFITMAKRASQPLEVEFEEVLGGIEKFTLSVTA